jgi:hypothetical protein
MRRFFAATFFVFFIAINAGAESDALCIKDCTTLGNSKEFCVSECSYENGTKQSQLDNLKPQTHKAPQNSQCLKICSEEGFKYQSCQQLCSKLPPADESEEPDADD